MMHGPVNIRLGRYLNCSIWLMKYILFEGKKIKLQHKWSFWKIKQTFCGTLKMQYISLFPSYWKPTSTGGFLWEIEFVKFPHFRFMSNEFKRNWRMVLFTQASNLTWFGQKQEPSKPKAHALAPYLYFNVALRKVSCSTCSDMAKIIVAMNIWFVKTYKCRH